VKILIPIKQVPDSTVRVKVSPDGNYLSVSVPFRGHLELTRHATVGSGTGLFAHAFHRWGYTTVGAIGYFHKDNSLVGLIATHAPNKYLYLTGVATLGLPDSPGVPAGLASLTLTAPFNDARAVADLFREHGGRIAAIIVEPYVGNAGFIAPESDFHPALRDVCDQYGALLIFDEVMTGFRVAAGGAQERLGERGAPAVQSAFRRLPGWRDLEALEDHQEQGVDDTERDGQQHDRAGHRWQLEYEGTAPRAGAGDRRHRWAAPGRGLLSASHRRRSR